MTTETLCTPTANPKYRIEGGQIINRTSGEAIPADEPVFILRAKDSKSLAGLLGYLDYLHYTEPGSSHLEAVRQCVKDFEAFQGEHPERVKQPDTTLPATRSPA